MNRRDFLGLFRGLVVLPFVKLPDTVPAVQPGWESAPGVPLPDDFLIDDAERIRQEYETLPPDDSHIDIGKLVSGGEFTSGQAVYMSEYTSRLEVWNGHGHIIGVAARDIAPGEVVEWRIGGNSKDIVTSGVARVKFTY